MRPSRIAIAACALIVLTPVAFAQQNEADEVNRKLQGGGALLPPVTSAPPIQDQDKRNGTIHLQGGQGNLPQPTAQAPGSGPASTQDQPNPDTQTQGSSTLPPPGGQVSRPSTPAAEMQGSGTITVEGRGEVSVAPDTAMVNSGVTTQAATAREALDANSAAMTKLIAALTASGIAPSDIQTSDFSVSPQYDYSTPATTPGAPQPPRLVGYQAVNTVTVRVRNLPALGAILDQAVTVGSNNINGISFTLADPTTIYAEARRRAYGDAAAKAALYAELSGGTLGDTTVISEVTDVGVPRPVLSAMAVPAAAPVPVSGGEVRYSVTVQVTWKTGRP